MILKMGNISKYILVTVLILVSVYVYTGNIGEITIAAEQNIAATPIGDIVAGEEVGQTFFSTYNNICGVSLKLATYMRKNTGYIVFGIREEGENKDIYSTRINVESVQDNQYYDFKFPPIKFSKGKNYYMYIRSEDGSEGNAITVYMSETNEFQDGEMMMNGQKKMGDLAFKVYYNDTYLERLFK